MMDTQRALDLLKTLFGLVAAVFAAFFFLDGRHAHQEDVAHTDVALRERILMSESTRYAEIAKFYTDKLQDGEELSTAETSRLELVQRQQERIAETLKDE